MQILRHGIDLPFLPIPNEITEIRDDNLPPAHLITSALALAFQGQRILMTNLNARGWDIPGGHLEPGETPEVALHREVWEETGVRLAHVRPFIYQRITLRAPCPPNYRYPYPASYQCLFFALVAETPDFAPTAETRERALFSPADAQKLRWVQENEEVYTAALAAASHVDG